MDINGFCDYLTEKNIKFKKKLDLSKVSTFKIGGICNLAVYPKDREELRLLIRKIKDVGIKYSVIGCASNVLFANELYEGILIFMSQMNQIEIKKDHIYAQCGARLSKISQIAFDNSLSGFEFAYGIPGSCGGAVYMNAGAYGGEISDALVYSEYYDICKDCFGSFDNSENNFSYRKSIYSDNENLIVLGAEFKFDKGDKPDIKKIMDENITKRKDKQPLEYPSAGSTFKRPKNGYAAQMIDLCGLKGLCEGDAQVSEKHAGFIINKGNATSDDVKKLILKIKNEVHKKFNVWLEEEIKYID